MSKYTRKQKDVAQDEFIGFWEKLATKAEPYARAIALTAVTALALVAGVWAISGWMQKKAEKATAAFGQVVRTYEADLLTTDEPQKSEEQDPVPRFKTEKERAQATLQALDGFDQKYGKSPIAEEAKLFRAGVYFDLGRFDEAAAAYESFLKEPHPSPLVVVAKEGLGLVREQQGKLDEALALYQKLEPQKGDFYRDRALWDQARIWRKKGDKKKAVELLKQLVAKAPTSPLKDDAQTRIAELEGT